MNEMIERVALAISGGDNPASILEVHRHRASAAIEAMREPTDAIVAAHHVVPDDTDFDERARANWRGMIDAALE